MSENGSADDGVVDSFKRDVERAGEERHVLSPARYQGRMGVDGGGNGGGTGNGKAVALDGEAVCERREDADCVEGGVQELCVRQEAFVVMLMELGKLRGGV